MACRITDLLGAEGNTDVDMILSDDGELHAIEVNTRPNGTRYISGAATGINPMQNPLVDMAIGNWALKAGEEGLPCRGDTSGQP